MGDSGRWATARLPPNGFLPNRYRPKHFLTYAAWGACRSEGQSDWSIFCRFLQQDDELVSADAYNEFAEASMEGIAALGDKLDRNVGD